MLEIRPVLIIIFILLCNSTSNGKGDGREKEGEGFAMQGLRRSGFYDYETNLVLMTGSHVVGE